MEKHVKFVHEKLRPFPCDRCPVKCSTSASLRQHISEVHDKLKPHVCHLCDYASARPEYLKKHLLRHHGIEKKKNTINADNSKHNLSSS